MKLPHVNFLRALSIGALLLFGAMPALAGKTQTVVLIVSDGLRWQEVFTGADPTLLNEKDGGSWLEEADLASATGARTSMRGGRRCSRSCGERWPSRGRFTAISSRAASRT